MFSPQRYRVTCHVIFRTTVQHSGAWNYSYPRACIVSNLCFATFLGEVFLLSTYFASPRFGCTELQNSLEVNFVIFSAQGIFIIPLVVNILFLYQDFG